MSMTVFDATVEIAEAPLDLDLPIYELLAELDKRTRQTQEQVNRLQRELHAETAARETADADERAARRQAVAHVDRRVAELAGGGLHVEWLGVAMFLVGTVLSTIPDELARLLA